MASVMNALAGVAAFGLEHGYMLVQTDSTGAGYAKGCRHGAARSNSSAPPGPSSLYCFFLPPPCASQLLAERLVRAAPAQSYLELGQLVAKDEHTIILASKSLGAISPSRPVPPLPRLERFAAALGVPPLFVHAQLVVQLYVPRAELAGAISRERARIDVRRDEALVGIQARSVAPRTCRVPHARTGACEHEHDHDHDHEHALVTDT